MQKILIVDDHQLVLDGLDAIITEMEGFKLLAKARNGKEGVQLTSTMNPDIVLMDIDMPIMNGLEACRQIKKDDPSKKVIILTMHNEFSLIKKVMEIGADGYLLKNADREEFYAALCQVRNGKCYFSADVTQTLLSPGKSKSIVYTDADAVSLSKLTEREIDVLRLISEGFSNKEIGEKLFISHRTVDTHRTNLMKKLDVHNIAGLIKFSIKSGLVG